MSGRPVSLLWRSVELDIPYGLKTSRIGRWQLLVFGEGWSVGRGDWPATWREQPTYTAPIMRWWQVGPVRVQRYREDIPR